MLTPGAGCGRKAHHLLFIIMRLVFLFALLFLSFASRAAAEGPLKWEPELEDVPFAAISENAYASGTTQESTLQYCSRPSQCRSLLKVPAGTIVLQYKSSSNHKYAFVWRVTQVDADHDVVDVIDLRAGAVVASWPGPGGAQYRYWNAPLHWTAGDNLVFWWGCGTECGNGVLFTRDGKPLADFSGASSSVSPRFEYAFGSTSTSSPTASWCIYDLRTGQPAVPCATVSVGEDQSVSSGFHLRWLRRGASVRSQAIGFSRNISLSRRP